MIDNEIKEMREKTFRQMKMVDERLESASFILERDANVDAIPILSRAVDMTVRILLSFKQIPLGNFQENIKSLEKEYEKEGFYDEETIESFNSLYEMNEGYKKEMEIDYDYRDVKSIFDEAENFIREAHKFLEIQLITPEERMIKRKKQKILAASGISICSLIVLFFLVKLGINIFGPKHGLLARYYNNIHLEDPIAVERIDKKIDFRWGGLKPDPRIGKEFSVRWEGRIKLDKNDHYTFYIMSDESFRFFIDDKIIIDTWSTKEKKLENSGEARLRKGFHKIRIEYYFDQIFADIILLWSSNSFKKRIVGKKVLFPPAASDISN